MSLQLLYWPKNQTKQRKTGKNWPLFVFAWIHQGLRSPAWTDASLFWLECYEMEIPPEPTNRTEGKKGNFLLIKSNEKQSNIWPKMSNLINRSVGLERPLNWFTFKSYINICFIDLIELQMKDKNLDKRDSSLQYINIDLRYDYLEKLSIIRLKLSFD